MKTIFYRRAPGGLIALSTALALVVSAATTGLRERVMTLTNEGRYRDALPLAEQLLTETRSKQGAESFDYALYLSILGRIHVHLGEQAQAEPLLREALALDTKLFGESSDSVRQLHGDMGDVCAALGHNQEAERHYRAALAGCQGAAADALLRLVRSQTSLALFLCTQGRFEEALPLNREALEIARRVLPPRHPEIAIAASNLATVLYPLSRYDEAVQLLDEAIAIQRAAPGDNTHALGSSLSNLAGIYQKTGRFERSETLYREALAIRRTAAGDHPDAEVAAVMANLTTLLYDKSDNAGAEQLARQTLALLGKLHGDAPKLERARVENTLSAVLLETGDLPGATTFLESSLAIRRKLLGNDHPDLATSLNNLGCLLDRRGQFDEAATCYREALAIRLRALGPESTGVPVVLDNLAINRLAAGDGDAALDLLTKARATTEKHAAMVFGFSDEPARLAFLRLIEGQLDTLLSAAVGPLAGRPRAVQAAADTLLRSKGLTLEAWSRQRAFAESSPDPELNVLFKELAEIHRKLATAQFAVASAKAPADLAATEERQREIEAELSRRCRGFEFGARRQSIDTRAIAAALPPASALVEFSRPAIMNFHATGTEPTWLPAHYVAVVIRPDSGSQPDLVDLGDAATIEQAVTRFREAVQPSGPAFRYLDFGQPNEHAQASREKPDFSARARALHDLVFAPLEAHLAGASRIIISPEGAISLFPFQALLDHAGCFLVERYGFSYRTAARDLLRPNPIGRQPPSSTRRPSAVVVADVDYGTAPHTSAPSRRTGLGEAPPLPGTAREAACVLALLDQFDTQLIGHSEATVAAVKALRSPKLLHIATHGFFLPVSDSDSPGPTGTRRRAHLEGTDPAVPRATNPLLRSGLVLAGANRADPADSGLLSALEVSGMSLEETDLVVLSACETGLGMQYRGEGVFGLPRAFFQAGVATVMLTLWKIPDEATVDLVESYYRHWLREGVGKADALRQAQLELLHPSSRPRPPPPPVQWAGFVLFGESD